MMKRLLLFALTLVSLFAEAHEIRPAYLQLQQVDENVYEAFWKVPARGDEIPALELVFPGQPQIEELAAPQFLDAFFVFSYRLTFAEAIEGKPLKIIGLNKTLIDVLVRIEYQSGEQITFLLQPDHDTEIIPGKPSTWQVVETYTVLGVEHILFGFDHLLFVLALIILARGKWKIVKTVTAFTIAHSVTLSMAALGFANVPGPPVEAVIALSIVFLAVEIVHVQQGKASLTSKKPWLVAFTFGLLHGFGFAGALTEIGLPQQAIPWALGFFNVGVELGQLAFVFVMLLLFYIAKKTNLKTFWPKRIVAYGIGSIASFWMIERVIGFWI